MADTARPRKRGPKARLSSWLKSFSGILASVATIVAAVASVFAAHQTSQVNQLNVIVRQQRQQLQNSPAVASGRSGSVGGAAVSGGTYLSALQPTVDYADLQTGTQTISANTYPSSITFRCDGTVNTDRPDEAFNVGGHALFRAVVGIPDNAQDATSLNETVIFANQSGTQLIKPVVVSLGKPAFVRIGISTVTQLEVTCSGADPHTQQSDNGNELTLGNAHISGS
jgi:hypothetical protein